MRRTDRHVWLQTLSVAVLLAWPGCRSEHHAQHTVCLQLPTAADNAEAMRGVAWWGEPTVFACPGDVVAHRGDAPPGHPLAYGWTDGSEIVWVMGPVYEVVRHEYGHVLGYGDSDDPLSAMYSGGAE